MEQQKISKIGFVCGTFDLCHTGHILMFRECKQFCDHLIVGLCVNPNIMQKEKNKPVETIFERYIRLKSIKYINEIIVYENEEDMKSILSSLKGIYGNNLIRFMDEKYKNRDNNEFSLDLNIFYNSRKHNYSSTNLRKRICNKK